jgi:hypothetical protein
LSIPTTTVAKSVATTTNIITLIMSTPRSSRCLHAESKQRGTSWARRLLRAGHSRGAPTKLVNAVADEHGLIGRQAAGVRARCLHAGDEGAVSVAADLQAIAVVLDLVHPVRPGRRLVGAPRSWDAAGRFCHAGCSPMSLFQPLRPGAAPPQCSHLQRRRGLSFGPNLDPNGFARDSIA